MADLLERVAGPLAGQDDGWAFVAGLRLVAVDGLTVDVPDSAVNAAEFGRPSGGAFPQVRVVAMAECGCWTTPRMTTREPFGVTGGDDGPATLVARVQCEPASPA